MTELIHLANRSLEDMHWSIKFSPRQSLLRAGFAPFVCIATLATSIQAADVKVYECDQDGTLTFSQEPCGDQPQQLDIQYDQPDQEQTESAISAARNRQFEADNIAQSDVLDNEIQRTEQQINRLQSERQERLAEMSQQEFRGSEERDEEAWITQMNQKMESVDQDYKARIISETARLDRLRAQRAALPRPGGVQSSPGNEGTNPLN
ncbi:MAG TPA: hypothetical protein DDY14_00830 [Chromatiaceae bacterium]|jgi:hypothetical protein|nr:MAG: hypothetical protein N838_03975 [Thiohalocapsa sp. PB-PSB1]HBG93878.1 hypothetical protein [Chromatiaceae bacterium]HCS91500.1 hypothetical protein [Chromatiaceae bacterium]